MPHDPVNLQHAFISDRDLGDETEPGAPSVSEPAPSSGEERVGMNGNGSRSSYSALARNRAPFPAGF